MNLPLTRWCDGIIKYSFLLLFTLVPLLLTPWNYELFEYNKMMVVYALTMLIATSWVIKSITQKEFRLARTPLDIPIALFVTSQLVSALFSIDPHVSWLGYYSRFNGGLWSILSYVTLYYAFISNFDAFVSNHASSDVSSVKNQESRKFLLIQNSISMILKVALATGATVSLYGLAQRLGIDKHIWVQDVQNRVFSTLGQPNWLAAYLVALIPLSMAFALKKSLWYFISLLFFTVLLFTRSRSGLLGFVIADVVFWGFLFVIPGMTRDPSLSTKTGFRLGGRNDKVIPALILHGLFALIIFINGTGTPTLDKYVTFGGLRSMVAPLRSESIDEQQAKIPAGPALEVGGTESGTIRTYVWQGAINAWKSTKKTLLIGTGVETFAFAFYQHRPAGHNLTSEWDFLYNKAHNEYLNYLATTGVLGLGSYLLFIGTFIIWFIKEQRAQSKEKSEHSSTLYSLPFALFAGWVSILITNFFGFSVVVVQLALFLFPALIIASKRQSVKASSRPLYLPSWTAWFVVLGGLYLVIRIGSFWYADTLFAAGYHAIRSGSAGVGAQRIQEAVTLNANEPLYHDELSSAYAMLAVAAFEAKNATQASELVELALGESKRALSISPNNVNFWKTRTKVYYTLSALDPALNAQAIEALRQARALSPNDPKIYYNLAILIGRTGDTDTAIAQLVQAKKLKKNYRDAYYALHVFYIERKESDKARAIVQDYLTQVNVTDEQFIELLDK